MVTLTYEQLKIKNHITSTDGMLLVSAGAGTGKSFMARQVVKALNPSRTLYTAFNKAIIVEASGLFDPSVDCKTFHALAYKYTKPEGDISAISYRDLPANLSYQSKYQILQGVEEFLLSSSSCMLEFFDVLFTDETTKSLLTFGAVQVIENMLNRKTPWSFSFMLKYFHLMLVEDPSICKYDLVILDEISDTTAVALEIFKLIQAPKKLGLGEPHQAIYAFMNLVNGFEELKNIPVYPLTHSFRCSVEIAESIEKFMQKELTPNFIFKGVESPVMNGEFLYCTLTNANIVRELSHCIGSGKDFKLLRKPVDIFACPLAVLSASSGKEVYQKNYKYLEDVYGEWRNLPKDISTPFFTYLLDVIEDKEVHSAVRLLGSLKKQNINLFDLFSKVKKVKQKGKYTVATVYTSKGLEFETVTLADEFNKAIQEIRDNGGVQSETDIVTYRCYYVACSRSGKNLYNALALKGQV